MLRNYEWVDYIFIQSTAWFLQHIIIVTTSSTEDHPYITISGNLTDERIPCQSIPLTIGTKSNVHYQSLLPIEVRVSRNQIKPSSPGDTIELELSKAMTSAKIRSPNLGSKEEFPDLMPSSSKPQLQEKKFLNLINKINQELQLQARISIASILRRKKKILKCMTSTLKKQLSSTQKLKHSSTC